MTPRSEMLVDHYFLSDFERILLAIEIIVRYKMLWHSEGMLYPCTISLSSPVALGEKFHVYGTVEEMEQMEFTPGLGVHSGGRS